MALEKVVLAISAGIGRTFAEAEAALFEVKKKKLKIDDGDPLDVAITKTKPFLRPDSYLISLYAQSGLAPLSAEETVLANGAAAVKTRAEKELEKLEELKWTYGEDSLAYESYARLLNEIMVDPSTGADTPLGYLINILRHKQPELDSLPEGIEQFYALFDTNDMHYWNAAIGSENVDERLHAIGRALVGSVRRKASGTSAHANRRNCSLNDLVSTQPSFISRTHGSAGDEFLVDFHCQEKDAIKIISRLFYQAIAAQYNIICDCC